VSSNLAVNNSLICDCNAGAVWVWNPVLRHFPPSYGCRPDSEDGACRIGCFERLSASAKATAIVEIRRPRNYLQKDEDEYLVGLPQKLRQRDRAHIFSVLRHSSANGNEFTNFIIGRERVRPVNAANQALERG